MRILRKQGYEVETADDAHVALEKIQAAPPQILITDWMMPGMDGLELIREVRATKGLGFVYVVLLTAHSGAQDLAQAARSRRQRLSGQAVRRDRTVGPHSGRRRIVELERSLRQLSENDALTGVLNRRTFRNQLQREWSRATRYEEPLSAVILDVDYFKRVNDDHGHAAGDAVLVAVGGLLRDSCRPSDYVCRYGGEEFVVLLPATNEEGATAWAERFRRALEDMTIQTGEKTLRVTSSFGVAERMQDQRSPECMVDLADQCLLVAKRTGRNKVVRNAQMVDLAVDPFGGDKGTHPLNGILAKDVMTTLIMTLKSSDSILQAVELVLQMRLPSVPVCDDEGRLVGIISEKDLMLLDIARDGWSKTVGDVMKTNVVSYDENMSAKEIFDFLCRVSIRRVVVVSHGQPVGMLSRDTYLRWYSNWLLATRAPGDDSPERDESQPVREGLMRTARHVTRQRTLAGRAVGRGRIGRRRRAVSGRRSDADAGFGRRFAGALSKRFRATDDRPWKRCFIIGTTRCSPA
ncbi:MAG: diguanylate cyclase [Pirellulales bacterium]